MTSPPAASGTLLADVVATSERVAATSSRSAKIAALADLLRRLEPPEVVPTVALLSGEARQGRIGIGWATLAALATSPAAWPGPAPSRGAPPGRPRTPSLW